MAGQAPRVAPYAPPRFAVDDPAGYAFLEEHGYAVFKDVVTPDQVTPPPIPHFDFVPFFVINKTWV